MTMDNILTTELIEKAKQTKSAEELSALAAENGIKLTGEEANTYFEHLNKTGELSDDELDSVSGGGCYNNNELVVTELYHCNQWTCPRCGKVAGDKNKAHVCADGNRQSTVCSECRYGVGWIIRVCKNPSKNKK